MRSFYVICYSKFYWANYPEPPCITNTLPDVSHDFSHRKYTNNYTHTILLGSQATANFADNFVVAKNRYKMTFELINLYLKYYNRLKKGKTKYLHLQEEINLIDDQKLLSYHTQTYLNQLKNPEQDLRTEISSFVDPNHATQLLDYAKLVAALSIQAAKNLTQELCQISINFFGGWHHSYPDKYEGFCFVNDIVFGIQKLQTKFKKILYFDIDVHHGDAVEKHFISDPDVLTFSCHKYMPGFYPGTSGAESTIFQKNSGERDSFEGSSTTTTAPENFENLAENVAFTRNSSSTYWKKRILARLTKIFEFYQFDAIVFACGADTLKHDPLNDNFMVELKDYLEIVQYIFKLNLPTLVVGGGGYKPENFSRLFTFITLLSLDPDYQLIKKLPMKLSHNLLKYYYAEYKPSYFLNILS